MISSTAREFTYDTHSQNFYSQICAFVEQAGEIGVQTASGSEIKSALQADGSNIQVQPSFLLEILRHYHI